MARRALFVAAALLGLGCTEKPTPPAVEERFWPAPTAPESLVAAIEVIYNDVTHGPEQRLEAYASLLVPEGHATLPAFVFRSPNDIEGFFEWGLADELEAHRKLFAAQAGREVEVALELPASPAQPIDPQPGREGWMRVATRSARLRGWYYNPDGGTEVSLATQVFTVAPADGRWYIVRWDEGLGYTWGDLKIAFLWGR